MQKDSFLADNCDISFQHVHQGVDLLMILGDVLYVARVSYERNVKSSSQTNCMSATFKNAIVQMLNALLALVEFTHI